MANHADPRTTKLYARRKDLAELSQIERRIAFEQTSTWECAEGSHSCHDGSYSSAGTE